jgi:hypothetical protein
MTNGVAATRTSDNRSNDTCYSGDFEVAAPEVATSQSNDDFEVATPKLAAAQSNDDWSSNNSE